VLIQHCSNSYYFCTLLDELSEFGLRAFSIIMSQRFNLCVYKTIDELSENVQRRLSICFDRLLSSDFVSGLLCTLP
jgi:hypothetical protein